MERSPFAVLSYIKRSKLLRDGQAPVYNIKPDFTITLPNKQVVFWEHLGMLDTRRYFQNWQERLEDYKQIGQHENLLTTDDLEGISSSTIKKIIKDIKSGNIAVTEHSKFSKHHYSLKE